eukprot:TRINITY_DN26515_c0_g1_i2.p2 TRINITY_DN26515_c0_g1~~TRINITY_DN26515_c0_g1_i2.p2  ORF type:complete len:101 (+),score=21.31 TRINITY_DN26515_c0_g1_i2:118-420(+)
MCIRDRYQRRVHGIVNVVLQCMSDPSPLVQEAVVLTLCYFSQELSSEIVEHHTKILPVLPVSYTHLRAHETSLHLVCRLLLEKKKHLTQPISISTTSHCL